MDIPPETEFYLRESIDFCVGLPVSTTTLETKLRVSQESHRRMHQQYLHLLSKFNAKDQQIQRIRAESSMNAQAVKKFVEENQKLAMECSNLLCQCKKWERECALYERDRDAVMDFGNEADERAKQAESRVHDLEAELKTLSEELRRLSEDLQFYKHQCEITVGDTSLEATAVEGKLVESLLTSLIGKDDIASKSRAFLEANSESEVCQSLLKMRNSLRPSTQNVLALLSEIKSLHSDKEHLRINLNRAEEEVKVLFEENDTLDRENKRLMRKVLKEGQNSDSAGKHTGSGSAKGSKRKSSPKMSSSVMKKIDLSDFDSTRLPLYPLQTENVIPASSE
ncbi:uncharacterized protein LOC141698399 isoform X1 [Apium graveolens]|uniref:uncharacterized protein LOC141698399 isoform X1 n=1 Tax=Apium graveolens TaxID=4045 RepID=UPI003D7C02B1